LTPNALEYYNALQLNRVEGTEMRTTIELSDDHRSALHSIAAQRGLRGYSKLIQEAIDFYIKQKEKKGNGLKQVLKMRGTWSKEEAKRVRKRLEEVRRNWEIG
jgi:predicted transcriptional regulator